MIRHRGDEEGLILGQVDDGREWFRAQEFPFGFDVYGGDGIFTVNGVRKAPRSVPMELMADGHVGVGEEKDPRVSLERELRIALSVRLAG